MPFARVRRRGHAQTRESRGSCFRRPGGGAFRGRGSASARRNRPMPRQGYSRWPSPLLSTGGWRCPLSFTEVGAYVLKLQHHSEMEKRAAGSVSLISRGALYAVFQWRKRNISTLAVFRLPSSSFELVAFSTWVSPPTPTPQINKEGRDKAVSPRSRGV